MVNFAHDEAKDEEAKADEQEDERGGMQGDCDDEAAWHYGLCPFRSRQSQSTCGVFCHAWFGLEAIFTAFIGISTDFLSQTRLKRFVDP